MYLVSCVPCIYVVSCVPCISLVSCVPWIVCILGSASQCVLHIAQSLWSSPVGAHCSVPYHLYHIHCTFLLKSISFTINHSTQCMNRQNTCAEIVERGGHYDRCHIFGCALCMGELFPVLLHLHNIWKKKSTCVEQSSKKITHLLTISSWFCCLFYSWW